MGAPARATFWAEPNAWRVELVPRRAAPGRQIYGFDKEVLKWMVAPGQPPNTTTAVPTAHRIVHTFTRSKTCEVILTRRDASQTKPE